MTLENIGLKATYYSTNDDLLSDFYIPCLSNSISYDRISGFFSSQTLAIASRGFSKFIQSNGRIRLITSVILTEPDAKTIKEVIAKKEREIIADIENLEDSLKKNHLKVLAWMLKKGILEIKVSCVIGKGIEHQKVGIFEDELGNKVCFYGSDNETAHGWLYHNESFHLARSWIEGEIPHLASEISNFHSLWNDLGSKTKVYPVSEAFKRDLIRQAPESDVEFNAIKQDIEKEISEISKTKTFKRKPLDFENLYEIQKNAVHAWFSKGMAGIIAMATGTGKTFTSCAIAKKCIEQNEALGIVVVTPQNVITNQWINESLPQFGLTGFQIEGLSKKELDQVANLIMDVQLGKSNYFIIGISYDSFYKKKFTDLINTCNFKLMLIADEVHSVGTENRLQGLIEKYDFRLGLSATPIRQYDPDGTQEIYNYFYKGKFDPKVGETYYFSTKDAIHTIDPSTGETYLVKYHYLPTLCELNEKEYSTFQELSKKIKKAYHFSKEKQEATNYQNLLMKRKLIVKNAYGKIGICEKIFNEIKELKHCLVFLDNNSQLNELAKVIESKFRKIIFYRYTSDKLSNLSERVNILSEFGENKYQILLSIGCFDEGVDVKPTEHAVFVASSTENREFIQRRGRVLRHSPGKECAYIYDILVVPPKDKFGKYFSDGENLVNPELKRFNVFHSDCENKTEALKRIEPLLNSYSSETN